MTINKGHWLYILMYTDYDSKKYNSLVANTFRKTLK